MISAWLVGDKEVVAQFDRFWPQVRDELADSVGRLATTLTRNVALGKLQDKVLHVRSGKLWRSIHPSIEKDEARVYGIVGTNVKYAAKHEFGFSGTESVREHLRMMKKAWGKSVKEPRKISVSAHSRQVNYPARSFLRSALAEMKGEIETEMQRVINSSASKVFKK